MPPTDIIDDIGLRAAAEWSGAGDDLDRARDRAALLTMAWALDGFPDHAGAVTTPLRVDDQHREILRRWEEEVARVGRERLGQPTRHEVGAAWQEAMDVSPDRGRGGALTGYFRDCSMNLAGILAGDIAVQALLFDDDMVAEEIYQSNPASLYTNHVGAAVVAERCRAVLDQGRTPVVLEVGGGVGGTTDVALDQLRELPVRYHFTDVSTGFTVRAQDRWAGRSGLTVGHFDINDPHATVTVPGTGEPIDVVLAANVMHNAVDVVAALDRLAACCAPGARLVLIETGTEHLPLLVSMRFLMSAPAGDRGFHAEHSTRDRILLPSTEWSRAVETSVWHLDAVLPPCDDPTHPVARQDQHVWLGTL